MSKRSSSVVSRSGEAAGSPDLFQCYEIGGRLMRTALDLESLGGATREASDVWRAAGDLLESLAKICEQYSHDLSDLQG